jgi:hypothetical protein
MNRLLSRLVQTRARETQSLVSDMQGTTALVDAATGKFVQESLSKDP